MADPVSRNGSTEGSKAAKRPNMLRAKEMTSLLKSQRNIEEHVYAGPRLDGTALQALQVRRAEAGCTQSAGQQRAAGTVLRTGRLRTGQTLEC